MKVKVVVLLVATLFVTSGSVATAQMCGKEYYQYYYPDGTFTGTPVGMCAQNDSCTGYNYCSGNTSTDFRIWETASCCTSQGGCHCAQKINGVWTRIDCPETAPCWSPVYP